MVKVSQDVLGEFGFGEVEFLVVVGGWMFLLDFDDYVLVIFVIFFYWKYGVWEYKELFCLVFGFEVKIYKFYEFIVCLERL